MPRISVKIDRNRSYWRLTFNIDGQVQPSHVVGCRDGLAPMIAGFLAAEAEQYTVWPATERATSNAPTIITVTMPSGRQLTFEQRFLDQALPDGP